MFGMFSQVSPEERQKQIVTCHYHNITIIFITSVHQLYYSIDHLNLTLWSKKLNT